LAGSAQAWRWEKRHERKAAIGDAFEGRHFRSLERIACITVRRWLQPRPRLVNDDVGERFIGWSAITEIERLLADLKGRRRLPG